MGGLRNSGTSSRQGRDRQSCAAAEERIACGHDWRMLSAKIDHAGYMVQAVTVHLGHGQCRAQAVCRLPNACQQAHGTRRLCCRKADALHDAMFVERARRR